MVDFFKKKESKKSDLANIIAGLKSQGYPDVEIIQSLKDQGYPPKDINDAFTQLDESGGEPYQAPTQEYASSEAAGDYEAVIEGMIEDKWNDFNRELSKIKSWKEETDNSLEKLHQEISDLKEDVDSLHKAILGKVGEYDKHLLDVGSELKAMEKVFTKIVPTLTESISELSRITKESKKGSKKS